MDKIENEDQLSLVDKKQSIQYSLENKNFIQKAIFWLNDENQFASSYIIVVVVAFSQGILSLSDLAISFLYKDDFQMSPAQVAVATGIVQIPWILKPGMGIVTDTVFFCGYRRKSYLILFALIQFICWNILAMKVTVEPFGIFIFFLIQFCVAFNNVIGEALLVEITQNKSRIFQLNSEEQQKEAGKNVSIFFGVKSIGTLITCYLGGVLLQNLDKYQVFRITSFFPFLLCIVAFRMNEKNKKNQTAEQNEIIKQQQQNQLENHQNHLAQVWKFLQSPSIYKPILFVFFYMITPTSSSAMFYFYTNQLGFQPQFLGQLKFVYASASILGMLIYNKYLKMVPFKKQFIVTTFFAVILGYSQIMLVTRYNNELGIPDKAFCLGDSIILQLVGELNIMPVLVLACRMCPKNIEGTMYAVVMSTLNFGSLISSQLGGLLISYLGITQTDFSNLWISILITNTSTIIPLIVINKIDFENIFTKEEIIQNEADRIQKQLNKSLNSSYEKSKINVEKENSFEIKKQQNKNYGSFDQNNSQQLNNSKCNNQEAKFNQDDYEPLLKEIQDDQLSLQNQNFNLNLPAEQQKIIFKNEEQDNEISQLNKSENNSSFFYEDNLNLSFLNNSIQDSKKFL